MDYLHLTPGQSPPPLTNGTFRAVIVSDVEAPQEWRERIASWLLASGCLYVVAWGVQCEAWHDTIDWVHLEMFEPGDILDDKYVYTTWHANEPLSEALWFAGQCAFHPTVELVGTMLLHIAGAAREAEMREIYAVSQIEEPEE